MKIVAADIGGTHARFGIAELSAGARPRLERVFKFRAAEHRDLTGAWQMLAAEHGGSLPKAAAIGVAAPIGEPLLRFVNSHWVIDTTKAAVELGVDQLLFLNDFGAVAHAVSVLEEGELEAVTGPSGPLPVQGVTSVLGPGTGLGVAMLLRRGGGIEVIETEGAHIGFAPLNVDEERIAQALQGRYGRASVERVVAGPGLLDIYRAIGGGEWEVGGPAGLWAAALSGNDPLAESALDQLVKSLGSVTGDLALAHGSNAVVIAGGLAQRMRAKLSSPLFAGRFIAKGRYRARMEGIPVRLATHPDPGLLGAAVAFRRAYGASG